ncbi:transposase [Streptomyces sp. NPDC021020]|uniref:transposase n=1 Tax=Streptomyces sp. NPDC021020 TaxID=3365109 RepID=UPI0037BCD7CA
MHVTETQDDGPANLITDIATTGPVRDPQALPRHPRPARSPQSPAGRAPGRRRLPVRRTTPPLARRLRCRLVGPVKASGAWQKKAPTGFARDDFTIDFDARTVTCPAGQATRTWVSAPAVAPYAVARFRPEQCNPCSQKPRCTRGVSGRTVNFLPQHLHEQQQRNRADQQDSGWRRRYGMRSGVEGTVHELANTHRARRPLPRTCEDPRSARPHRRRHRHQPVNDSLRTHATRAPEGSPPSSSTSTPRDFRGNAGGSRARSPIKIPDGIAQGL